MDMEKPEFDLHSLLDACKPKVGNTLFIAVDGHGGSGKSTFANLLSRRLGATLIRTDDFAGWDNQFDWWPLVIDKVFNPIQSGVISLSYERSKWWANHHPEPVIDQLVTPIMILEGVSSSRREFREYLSLCIFVDTPKEVCIQRGIERDKATGTSEEELVKMWNEWFRQEDIYILRDEPQKYADIVVDGTKPFGEQIKF
jgi:uridine kinase